MDIEVGHRRGKWRILIEVWATCVLRRKKEEWMGSWHGSEVAIWAGAMDADPEGKPESTAVMHKSSFNLR